MLRCAGQARRAGSTAGSKRDARNWNFFFLGFFFVSGALSWLHFAFFFFTVFFFVVFVGKNRVFRPLDFTRPHLSTATTTTTTTATTATTTATTTAQAGREKTEGRGQSFFSLPTKLCHFFFSSAGTKKKRRSRNVRHFRCAVFFLLLFVVVAVVVVVDVVAVVAVALMDFVQEIERRRNHYEQSTSGSNKFAVLPSFT